MWWEMLDIDKDADLRQIKRAYAKKLKGIDQHKNPEDFMKINEVYQAAVESLKRPVDIQDKQEETQNTVSHVEVIESEPIEQNQSILEEKLLALYHDQKRCHDIKEWQAFFNDLTLDEEKALKWNAKGFFNQHYSIPQDIFVVIGEKLELVGARDFHWDFILDGRIDFKGDGEHWSGYWELIYVAFHNMLYEHYSEAINCFDLILEKDPDNLLVKRSRIKALVEIKDYEALTKTLENMKEQGQELMSYHYHHASLAYDFNNGQKMDFHLKHLNKNNGYFISVNEDRRISQKGIRHLLYCLIEDPTSTKIVQWELLYLSFYRKVFYRVGIYWPGNLIAFIYFFVSFIPALLGFLLNLILKPVLKSYDKKLALEMEDAE